MKIFGHWNYKRALILTIDRMKGFNDKLLNFCERIKYSGMTKKNKEIIFDNFDEMLRFDNFAGDSLKQVEITGYKEFDIVFKIKIKDYKGMLLHYYNTLECFYYFDSVKDETVFLSETQREIKKATPNYWLVGKFSFFGATFISAITFTIINYLTGNLNVTVASVKHLSLWLIIVLVIPISFIGLIWLIDNRFFYNIFPAVAFLWGEEKERYDRWQKLRSNVFWTIFIPLIMLVVPAVIRKLT